jgi:predicted RNA binding protein YcfA (HicA-like mRNA interferase family)
MGSNLPILSGRDVVRVFEKFGWAIARQRGSHIVMIKENEIVTLISSRP